MKKSTAELARDALNDLITLAQKNICTHEETHRGGAIWEICEICGAKWADDEGGKPEYEESPELVSARQAIAALEAEIAQPVEPVACVSRSNDMEGLVQWALKRVPVGTMLYAAPQEPAGWQPIATAPKDFVTEFDGWNGERVPNVSWCHPEWSEKGHYDWCIQEYVQHHGYSNQAVKGLTHWMPLPAPPKATP